MWPAEPIGDPSVSVRFAVRQGAVATETLVVVVVTVGSLGTTDPYPRLMAE
jgi:hypothetical protein